MTSTNAKPVWYFAYGSNMSTARLEERLGKVNVICRATVKNFDISFLKLSRDGSGKTDLLPSTSAETPGVVFGLSKAQLEALKKIEGGYEHKIRGCADK